MPHWLSRLCLPVVAWCCFAATGWAQNTSIDSMITPSSLKQWVQRFSADSFQGRLSGTDDAAKAAYIISDAFKQAGVLPTPENNGYLKAFIINHPRATAYNVIGIIPGRSKASDLVIFSAHYDHLGTTGHTIAFSPPEKGRPEPGDTIYNGA